MKIYFKKSESVPFSKWCEENNLAITITGNRFRYSLQFKEPLCYYNSKQEKIKIHTGGNSLHTALIELMKILNSIDRVYYLLTNENFIDIPTEGICLDFTNICTQEIIEL